MMEAAFRCYVVRRKCLYFCRRTVHNKCCERFSLFSINHGAYLNPNQHSST